MLRKYFIKWYTLGIRFSALLKLYQCPTRRKIVWWYSQILLNLKPNEYYYELFEGRSCKQSSSNGIQQCKWNWWNGFSLLNLARWNEMTYKHTFSLRISISSPLYALKHPLIIIWTMVIHTWPNHATTTIDLHEAPPLYSIKPLDILTYTNISVDSHEMKSQHIFSLQCKGQLITRVILIHFITTSIYFSN